MDTRQSQPQRPGAQSRALFIGLTLAAAFTAAVAAFQKNYSAPRPFMVSA